MHADKVSSNGNKVNMKRKNIYTEGEERKNRPPRGEGTEKKFYLI